MKDRYEDIMSKVGEPFPVEWPEGAVECMATQDQPNEAAVLGSMIRWAQEPKNANRPVVAVRFSGTFGHLILGKE